MNPVKDFAIQRPELANPAAFHQRLTRWNSRRLQPAIPSDDWQAAAREDAEMIGVEGAWIERMRKDAEPWLADLPDDPEGFIAWFEALKGGGPGENDPLFPWLAEAADLESMRWFLLQEVAGEAGFDDLVAMAQVRMPDGPKLVRIDLSTNRPAQTIAFDEDVAPQGTYLNDVRFSPDGRHAYITDSGAPGSLIVVNLESGEARRLLEGHPTTTVDEDVVVSHRGQPVRRPDGRGAEFAADSIELSKDGERLYWKPLTGRTLYSIRTDVLEDPQASADEVAAAARDEGQVGVTDGLWLDDQDRLYLSALEEDAVKVREGDRVSTLIEDERLRWPDTFSQGPDGAIYVTTSRIMDMAWFKPDSPIQLETQLWKFLPPSEQPTGSVTPEPAQ